MTIKNLHSIFVCTLIKNERLDCKRRKPINARPKVESKHVTPMSNDQAALALMSAKVFNIKEIYDFRNF